jgi:hypothetical protein
MIPTEVSELIRTKKLFLMGLDAMCGARLGEYMKQIEFKGETKNKM